MHTLYRTIKEENIVPVEGTVKGDLPEWLCGSLYRNGLGMTGIGDSTFNHLFDSLAMLTRFHIENKKVTYQNRFLQSEVYTRDMAAQKIVVSSFGTLAVPDPCKNIFKRYLSYFSPYERNDNCNISIFPVRDELYATSESNLLRKIDPYTLEALETVDLMEVVAVNNATAHPHYESDGTIHNIGISGKLELCIIKFPPKTDKQNSLKKGQIMSAVRSSGKVSINYLHSFGITDNYYVYVEQPLFLNILKLVTAKYRRSPLSGAFEWYPDIKTRFRIIKRTTGEELNPEVRYEADPFLFFHQINTYEDNGHIVLDTCAFSSGEPLNFIYLKNLSSVECEEKWRQLEEPQPRRYVLPLDVNKQTPKNKNLVELNYSAAKAEMTSDSTIHCTWEVLADIGLEIPQINYAHFNGKKYRYIYGLGWHNKGRHFNTIAKIDINTKTYEEWGEDDCYPSEPVFVPNPHGTGEDDGVVLAAVNNSNFDKGKNPFLLVLDAKSMVEIARAEFGVQRFPRDFHGYFRNA